MAALQYFTVFALSCVISLMVTGIVLKYLKKKAILDHPNERSSHSIATPRGGGLGILITLIPGLLITQYLAPVALPGFIPMVLSLVALSLLSWLDDLYTLGPAVRFLLQITCVTLCLIYLPTPEQGYLGGFIPVWVEKIIIGFGWVWFINLFNFMDGIDGISGTEVLSIGIGIALISFLVELNQSYIHIGLLLAGSALGFLKWNWHKAKLFMGDVGSVPLGFVLGWMLILLAAEGFLIIALLLPLYYLADATFTLLKRALRKEKIWEAHKEHLYQKATQSGLSHDQVVLRIAIVNIILIATSVFSLYYSSLLSLVIGASVVSFCLFSFGKRYKDKQANS